MLARGCVLAIAALGLFGCEEVAGDRSSPADGIRTVSLLGGDVLVRGPQGYCVDQAASDAQRGFAVLAGCVLLARNATTLPALDALITVQFGDADTASVTGNEDAFAAFLESNAGRGVLASSGKGANVTQIATIADKEAVLAWFDDTTGPSFLGTTGPQWRGFLDIRGRLVTVSVLSFARNTLSRGEGERLLVVAMAELSEANALAVTTADNS